MNKIKNFINWKGLILGIIVFLLFYFSSYFQLIPIILLNWDIRSITESQNVMLSTFSNIVLLLILFLIFRKDIIKEWKKFKSNFLENIDTGIKYWLVGLAIMMGSNIIINIVMNLGQAANEQAVQQMISALPWLMFINAGIIAPCTVIHFNICISIWFTSCSNKHDFTNRIIIYYSLWCFRRSICLYVSKNRYYLYINRNAYVP